MKEEIKNCFWCEKEFLCKNKRNIYCSRNCSAAWSRANKGHLTNKICKNCGVEFDAVGNSKTFCSKDCRKKYFIKNPVKYEYELVCNYCGKIFIKILANKPKKDENHYCGQECVGHNKNKLGTGKIIFCKECGKEFNQIHKRHFFCFEKCKSVYSNNHVIMKIVFCSNCNKEIERPKNRKRKNSFCGRKCESLFREKEADDIRICKYCKKEFKCKKGDKLVFCSSACRICGMNKGPTKPHREIIKFIKELGLSFKIEKPIKRYSIDVYLLEYNLGLEVMGEYWHCDNRLYKKPKSKAQTDVIKKDKKKTKYFKDHNLPLLYLWEIDINKNFDVCKRLIIEFIKNCGILYNYHSMNYNIENNKLILNKKILIPYFER